MPWHDATLLELSVDRRRPGHVDEVTLAMRWPSDVHSIIRFVECFKLIANMNFNIIADECVLTATESDDDEALRQQRDTWSKMGVDVASLKQFRIELNSTGGTIVVIARSWREETMASDQTMTFEYNDHVQLANTLDLVETIRGRRAHVVGFLTVENDAQVMKHGHPLGTKFLLVEFDDGTDALVLEALVERVADQDVT